MDIETSYHSDREVSKISQDVRSLTMTQTQHKDAKEECASVVPQVESKKKSKDEVKCVCGDDQVKNKLH